MNPSSPSRGELRAWKLFFATLGLINIVLFIHADARTDLVLHSLGFLVCFIALVHVCLTDYKEE